jgi:hypothetical protein
MTACIFLGVAMQSNEHHVSPSECPLKPTLP